MDPLLKRERARARQRALAGVYPKVKMASVPVAIERAQLAEEPIRSRLSIIRLCHKEHDDRPDRDSDRPDLCAECGELIKGI